MNKTVLALTRYVHLIRCMDHYINITSMLDDAECFHFDVELSKGWKHWHYAQPKRTA